MKEILLITNLSVTREHPNIQVVSEYSEEAIASSEGVLLHHSSEEFALSILSKIRHSSNTAVYLKPVALLANEPVSEHLEYAVDMFTTIDDSYENLNAIRAKFRNMVDAIANIRNINHDLDKNIALKIIRYLYVRDTALLTRRSAASIYGYFYPQIELFFSRKDKTTNKILQFLEDQHLLNGTFVDKVHFCGACNSAFLNFREICPQCQSPSLETKDMIHHFYCAHMGPESDFEKKGASYICPKCDRVLRHIGVDYDKPSTIHQCQECKYSTQDPDVDTLCFNCGHKATPDFLIHSDIKDYSLTALADNAALYGIENLFTNVLREELHLTDQLVFKHYLDLEIARIIRYKNFNSSLCLLYIENLDKIYLKLDKKAHSFFTELATIVKEILRTTDVVTSYTDSIFMFLLTETPKEGAEIAMGRIKEQVVSLIKHNMEESTEILTDVRVIDGSRTQAELVEDMLQNGIS